MDLSIYMAVETEKPGEKTIVSKELNGLKNGPACQAMYIDEKFYFVTSSWSGACTSEDNSAHRYHEQGVFHQDDNTLETLKTMETHIFESRLENALCVDAEKKGLSTLIIAGIVAGSLVFIGLVALAVWYFCFYKKKTTTTAVLSEEEEEEEEEQE
jgi:hypothetical protein